MAGLSPTQRTLQAMRRKGRICAIAEKNIIIPGMPYPLKQDLFGIIDLIVLDPEYGLTGIQSCGMNFSAHLKKMTESTDYVRGTELTRPELCREWLYMGCECGKGGRLELWGWRKIAYKRGGKLKVWSPRIHVFSLDDFNK